MKNIGIKTLNKMFIFLKGMKIELFLGLIISGLIPVIFNLEISIFQSSLISSINDQYYENIKIICIKLAVAYIITQAISVLGMYLFSSTTALFEGNIRKTLYNKTIHIKEGNLYQGEVATLFTSDVERVSGILWILLRYTRWILSGLLGFFYISTQVDIRLAFITIAFGMVSFMFQFIFVNPEYRTNKEIQNSLESVTQRLLDIISGNVLIKSLGIQKPVCINFQGTVGKLKKSRYKLGVLKVLRSNYTKTIQFVSQIGLLVIGSFFVAKGELELSALLAVPWLSTGIIYFFMSISNFASDIQGGISSLERISSLLNRSEEDLDGDSKEVNFDFNRGVLKLTNVSYGYSQGKGILKDISLEIQCGKFVAIVGNSGCGKTTLIKIIMGLLQQSQGDVELWGIKNTECSLRTWRHKFSYVPQLATLFYGTFGENLAMADVDMTYEDMYNIINEIQANDFIDAAGGLDANVGDLGTSMSGGQKQKISIGRALGGKAPIIILDEATASLDKEYAKYIVEVLEKRKKDHTIIIVTHRIEEVIEADCIYFMKDGTINSFGTHEELLNKDLYYRELWESRRSSLEQQVDEIK